MDVHRHMVVGSSFGKLFGVFGGEHRLGNILTGQQIRVFRRCDTKDEDIFGKALTAQRQRFLQIGDAKPVDALTAQASATYLSPWP